ncbi:hypothetical protein WMY93_000613 [Mugilogobius chulae]|uniref:Uncharacterized protein n=1 Tax=Mugilogobius chulae TaxID=88201 RepID=A0AAW0Q9V2_9GOBI
MGPERSLLLRRCSRASRCGCAPGAAPLCQPFLVYNGSFSGASRDSNDTAHIRPAPEREQRPTSAPLPRVSLTDTQIHPQTEEEQQQQRRKRRKRPQCCRDTAASSTTSVMKREQRRSSQEEQRKLANSVQAFLFHQIHIKPELTRFHLQLQSLSL